MHDERLWCLITPLDVGPNYLVGPLDIESHLVGSVVAPTRVEWNPLRFDVERIPDGAWIPRFAGQEALATGERAGCKRLVRRLW